MKNILGLVVLSLFAISASAADLMASSAAPTVTQNIVVEGAACPGVGATGFSSTGLLLSCQSGIWRHGVGYGGSYITKNGACNVANTVTGGCTCPAGYSTKQTSQGGYYHYSPWDTYYFGYVCELL
ncbi:hypothetical protein [Pseudomonas aeruginosa]|uniref:hypothetical protein n=1 Tax=Pseudomonas aeruginosa TaxID=287 RepID=UPI00287E90AF|nr:hypothetical protein [Pseudomonas aeruginosa]MDS9628958.1 hypothetical protein [Pseudomonas aeruginosa]